MTQIENRCCNCATPAYPCRDNGCLLKRVRVTYCDRCDEEISPGNIYCVDGEDVCEDCLKEIFRKE